MDKDKDNDTSWQAPTLSSLYIHKYIVTQNV